MKLLSKLQASKKFWFLFITSVIFFLLRLPSLFEPYWYGDEGIYEVIGFALHHGRFLYTGIWDNKPPVLYLIYAIFSGDQMAAKFLSLLAGLGATWALFFLSKRLFANFLPTAIATGLFAFIFGIPLIEGNIANAENFMLLPAILAGFLVYISVQTNIKKTSPQPTPKRRGSIFSTFYLLPSAFMLVAGLLLGLSFLTKVVGVFDLAAFAVFVYILSLQSYSLVHIIKATKRVIPLIVGFLIPVILCTLYFVFHHAFSEFFHSTLSSNVGYVNYANSIYLPAGRQVIPQGFLILKTLILALIVLGCIFWRKKISKEFLFVTLWLVFSVYNSLFSGRPYTHYALVILPSFALLVGLFIQHRKTRIVTGAILIVTLLFLTKSFTYYDHPFGYYINFTQYILGQKNTTSYQAFFDGGVPRDYAISQFINIQKKPGDTIFVWGNSGQIYKLTNTLPAGRFIVAYWVGANLPETQAALTKHEPTFIISLPNEPPVPYSLAHYQEIFTIEGATIYEHNAI